MKKTTIALIAAAALLAVAQSATAGGLAHQSAPAARLNIAPGPTLATPMPRAPTPTITMNFATPGGGSNDHNRVILTSHPGHHTIILTNPDVSTAVGPATTPSLVPTP